MFKSGDLALIVVGEYSGNECTILRPIRTIVDTVSGPVWADYVIELSDPPPVDSLGWAAPSSWLMPLNPPPDMKVQEKGEEVTS